MPNIEPPKADEVRKVVEDRLAALKSEEGYKETLNVEWRGALRAIPVIQMPVNLLSFNPDTHRVRAQRTLDAARNAELAKEPFGANAQNYLHDLLRWDPSDPSGKVDPAFESLVEDIREHGQNDPGLITRSGVLINGNTRAAALRELNVRDIRVAVLPPDASIGDTQAIELSLQLRRDLKRAYSFMNQLLAIDDRIGAGWSPEQIQKEFRIQARTLEKNRWVLAVVRELIERSRVEGQENSALRLVDFERDQGKFDELHRAYVALKARNPEEAEALREQRLLAILLDKSKTDVRLIEPTFAETYLASVVPDSAATPTTVTIPGTTISAPGPSAETQRLAALTTQIARSRAIMQSGEADTAAVREAAARFSVVRDAVDDALDKAGKSNRIVKKRLGPSERLSDANEDLSLAVIAIGEARGTNNFDAADLDEGLREIRSSLMRLAQAVIRPADVLPPGLLWLREAAALADPVDE